MHPVAPSDYEAFLRAKVKMAERLGFDVLDEAINPRLKPHQRATVRWLVAGGRRACFLAFGLGKSVVQLEAMRLVIEKFGGRALIVLPLGVRQEFQRDAVQLLGWAKPPKFIRSIEECEPANGSKYEVQRYEVGRFDQINWEVRAMVKIGEGPEFAISVSKHANNETARNRCAELSGEHAAGSYQAGDGIYLTNYETVRDGKLDPREFVAVSLDEASVLRGFGGTKTFRELMATMAGDDRRNMGERIVTEGVRFRFVATATPSPNEYIELLAYSAFLGVMDVGQAKTRFFKRNSEKADQLTIHPHKEREFWLWVSSWALFVQKPSDLGFSDEGYELPPLKVNWHEVSTDHRGAGMDRSGQARMFRNAAIGVQDAASEKRESLPARFAKLMEIRAEAPEAHRVIWHDLEAEREALEKAIPNLVTVRGADTDEHKERAILGFSDGEIAEIGGKPCMLGSGVNWQRHCAWAVFLGIGFKFNDFIQAVHRVYRFLQTREVRIDLIYTEAEREVRKQLERKWTQHNEMVQKMTEIIREYGLSESAMVHALTRKMGVERMVIEGDGYTLANNDCVDETRRMEANSVGLILTSIPFSTQYEYSPNYADFGHSDGNEEFFKQMDFLTPELLRVLKPGRVAVIHVKDRVVPGGMTGLGFQTVYPFHAECIRHYTKHGFAYMGMKTIVTDVVRENAQTYRLGWTEQCKDASKMGCGMSEYLLLFRKPPTDRSRSYADDPVEKMKARYTRARWQFDAHGFMRSSGNRLLSGEELRELAADQIFQIFKKHSLERVYDFELDVKIGEALDAAGKLPPSFMLLQPQSWSEDVWSDVTRMRTLNGAQSAKGKEMHLCPMQFDIADRVIEQFSMRGDKVLDPFGGLMTVPYRAVKLWRHGIGIELSPAYFIDGACYCKAASAEMSMPELFDLLTDEGSGKDNDLGSREVSRGVLAPEPSGANSKHGALSVETGAELSTGAVA